MGIEIFFIGFIMYVVMGIGTAKILASLNSKDSSYDGGLHFLAFSAWPLFIIVSAFWNFKND